jgi:AcrR family transcriptional regulator
MTLSRKISRKAAGVVNPSRGWTQRRDSARAQRAEATRLALIEAARELFTSRGYHEVGVRDFAAQAGVTRGALYHHFTDKEALFMAVFDAVEQELMSKTSNNRSSSSDAWTRFLEGIQVYLAAVTRPDVQRITLIDGPAVLGWPRWRQLEEGYSLGSITAALKAAMSARLIRSRPIEPLAHLIFGSIMEAALLIAHSDDPQRRSAEVGRALDDLLRGLEKRAR